MYYKCTACPRKLSAKKLEKLRAEALTNEQGEVYKGYPHTFWAFCKAMLGQTLSIMTEQVSFHCS